MFEVKRQWDVRGGVFTFAVAVVGTAATSRSRRKIRVAIPLQQHLEKKTPPFSRLFPINLVRSCGSR
jgi:hypothetical protein